MNPTAVRDDLRAFLNSKAVSLTRISRETELTLSWLSKFRRGVLRNPTTSQLAALWEYRNQLKSPDR